MIIFTVHTIDYDDATAEVDAAFETRESAEQYVVDRINEVHDTAELPKISHLAPSDTVFINDQTDGAIVETVGQELLAWVITAVNLDH